MAATKNSSTKPASTPATPASASNIPVITPQAIAAADTADLLNEGTKCSAPVKAIGMNCPLPLRFKTASDAIAAFKEQKAKVSAMESVLNEAETVFMTEEGDIFFGFETRRRFETELPWLELRRFNGALFGFVDPAELLEFEKDGDDLEAIEVHVNTDGVQLPVVLAEIAWLKHERKKTEYGADRFRVISVYAEAFDREVRTPFAEAQELLELTAKAVEQMAVKFGKKK